LLISCIVFDQFFCHWLCFPPIGIFFPFLFLGFQFHWIHMFIFLSPWPSSIIESWKTVLRRGVGVSVYVSPSFPISNSIPFPSLALSTVLAFLTYVLLICPTCVYVFQGFIYICVHIRFIHINDIVLYVSFCLYLFVKQHLRPAHVAEYRSSYLFLTDA